MNTSQTYLQLIRPLFTYIETGNRRHYLKAMRRLEIFFEYRLSYEWSNPSLERANRVIEQYRQLRRAERRAS